MYQYKSAIGRLKGYNQRWLSVTVGDTALNTLVNTYREIYFTLHETTRNIDVVVKLSDLTQQYSSVTSTVKAWLTSIGNTALPETTAPTFKNSTVKFKHAVRASFKLGICDISRLSDTSLPNIDKPDISLKRESTVYSDMVKYCMVSVNGYLHRIDANSNALYVYDGATSARIANETEVGIYSFKDVGALEYISITKNMIFTPNPGDKLSSGAYIRLPKSIGSKIPILVLGGYLHVLDSIYTVTGDNVIKVNMLSLNFIQRFLESKDYIDLSNIALTKSDIAPGTIIQSELFSDDNIKEYLSLSQSFIVLVDTPHLYTETKYVNSSLIPGRWEYPSYLTQPLVGNLGRLVEYWVLEERKRWMVCTKPHHRKRYHLETMGYESINLFDTAQDTIKPFDKELVKILEIGRDK